MSRHRTEHAVPHIVADRKKMSDDDVARLRQDRDPCAKCGVRHDYHATMGCKRFVAEIAA